MQNRPTGSRPEASNLSPDKIRPSPTATNAGGALRTEQASALKQSEVSDQRRSELASFAMDHWNEPGGATTCFGVAVDATLVPDVVVDCLSRIEADYELDLIASLAAGELAVSDIGDFLENELRHNANEAEALAAQSQTQDLAAVKHAYERRIGKLQENGNSNAEIIMALAKDQTVPESERAKLQGFSRILSIAAAVPEDDEIIRRYVNQIDLSQGLPDAVSFARAFVFDASSSHVGTGVSVATQTAIAEELGIERSEPNIATGSDMIEVFEKGVGIRRVRDPETGEFRTEPIHLQPGEFAPIRENQSIGLTKDGRRALKFDTQVGQFVTPLPNNAGPEDMVMYGLAGQMISGLHEVNMAGIFFPGRNGFEFSGGELEIRMPGDFNRAQRLCQIFYGGMAGYDGELVLSRFSSGLFRAMFAMKEAIDVAEIHRRIPA